MDITSTSTVNGKLVNSAKGDGDGTISASTNLSGSSSSRVIK
jgi:hypothetical protein